MSQKTIQNQIFFLESIPFSQIHKYRDEMIQLKDDIETHTNTFHTCKYCGFPSYFLEIGYIHKLRKRNIEIKLQFCCGKCGTIENLTWNEVNE